MNIWDQLVDCICRPPRDVYKPEELLGGSNQTFMIGAMECTRLDYELVSRQGMKLQCSHYFPLDAKSQDDKLPVVVYCHCNSGSRRDAEEAIYHLLPCGVGVVAFDFTGSGLSDGKWVTLGAHEVEDLAVVVKHLRSQGGVSSIGLWGRSMGAVTALLYSHLDPDIAGMVLDSPFSRLTDLMLEIVVSQRLPIPKVMLKLALRLMRNSVKRKAGCDINTVNPLDVVPRSAIPAMFGHGEEDSFINIQHSVKLYEAYNSTADAPVYKNLVRFKGDHNHPRPAFFYSSVCCFFHQQLKLDQVLLGGNPADTQQLMKYGSLALSSAYADHLDRANGFINTPWSLEPVSALSPEDQAAAAAAAASLADEPGLNGSASNGGSGSVHAGHGSSAAVGVVGNSNSGLGGLSFPPRIAVPAAHITEGGLNSPRAAAAAHSCDAGQMLVPVDACASSSGSSGGGRHAGQGGRAAGMGRSPHDASVGQQQPCLGSAGSPVSPLRQHQQQHKERHQQQQQGMSPQPAAAVAVPGVRPTATGDELFAVGSRGAPGGVLGAHETLEGSCGGAGAGTGLSDSRGSGGSFGAAGEQLSKWLFKRSSTSGSTPSTSPPVAASEGGAASGSLRPRSSGSGHAGSGRQDQSAGAAAAWAAGGAAAAWAAGGAAMQTSPLAAVVHHRQQHQQPQQVSAPHDTQGLQLSGSSPRGRGAGAAAVGPGVLSAGGGGGGGAAPSSLDEEEQMLQAAIALSLAESTQQEQQRPTAAVAAP